MQWYLGNGEISVVQRSVMEVYENIVVAKGLDVSSVMELEAIETVFAFNGPLLGGRWCHYGGM